MSWISSQYCIRVWWYLFCSIINERDLRKCQFLRISAFCISNVLSLKQKWMTFYYLPSWRSIQEKRCAALKSGVCKDIYFTLQLVIHRNNAKNITMSSYVSSISSNLVFYHFIYICNISRNTTIYYLKYSIMAAKNLIHDINM